MSTGVMLYRKVLPLRNRVYQKLSLDFPKWKTFLQISRLIRNDPNDDLV